MKKIISILLVLTMIFSMSAMMSFAAEETLSIVVASDIHYDENGVAGPRTTGQMSCESAAIFDAFLKKAAASEEKYVILAGDLTDSGSKDDAEAMAAKLRAFETETQKKVYVVPGNHDVAVLTKADFVNIYNDFGYSEALVRDAGSISYTVDVDADYRLLMIDTTAEKAGGNVLSEERVNWIKAQCEQAKSDKKHLVAVMHHNLLQHFAFDFMHEGAVIDESWGLKELFCENDVKYTFSGHSHAHDIMQYTGKNGNTIYEAVSSALNLYPVSYRTVAFTKSGVKFNTQSITEIDISALENSGLSEDELKLIKSDFMAYAHIMYSEGVQQLFANLLRTDTLCELLGVTLENNEDVYHILDKVGDKIQNVLQLPLYTEFKEDYEGQQPVSFEFKYRDGDKEKVIDVFSIQEIAESYGGRMVESTYRTILELLAKLYEIHVAGEDGLTAYSKEYSIMINSFEAAMNYCLYSLTQDEYGILIQFLASKLNPILGRIPEEIYTYMAAGHDSFERNIIFVTYLMSPFLKDTVSDADPSDNNATLGAYAAFPAPPAESKPEENKPAEDNSFRAKFIAFFDKIAEFFRSIFSLFSF